MRQGKIDGNGHEKRDQIKHNTSGKKSHNDPPCEEVFECFGCLSVLVFECFGV